MTEQMVQDIAHDAIQREFDPNYANDKVGFLVKGYVYYRDKLRALDEEYTKQKQPMVDVMNKLSGLLQEFLDKTNATSVKTEEGTFYQSTKYTASLADPQ